MKLFPVPGGKYLFIDIFMFFKIKLSLNYIGPSGPYEQYWAEWPIRNKTGPHYREVINVEKGLTWPKQHSKALETEAIEIENQTAENFDRREMEKALRIYAEVLRLVRRLPKDSRPYYAKYARENFVNYREVDANDAKSLEELFHRAYNHSVWVLNKVTL